MDFTSYQLVAQNTASLNTASYLNSTEYALFVNGFTPDLWFGFSANDVIEFGVWDRSKNLVGWGVLDSSKSFNPITNSYLNTLNMPVTYSYAELVSDFILFQNSSVLVSPPEEVQEVTNLTSGSFFLVYNFTREMAGNIVNPLVIKEISPSRTELKLLPISASTEAYDAFVQNKIVVSDVSPLYLQALNSFQCDKIYAQIKPLYPAQIATLQQVFFLPSDGAVVNFLKNLYEDLLIFTNNPSSLPNGSVKGNDGLIRIQGIQTYFNNYLLQNSDSVLNFLDLDTNFNAFVSASVERKFAPIGENPAQQYVDAKAFVYAFFTQYFYQPISNALAGAYNAKYYSYLKNGLNFGSNRILPILNTGMMDERQVDTDPFTLLVKLTDPLPNDIMAQSQCWVSNISLTPYVVNSVVLSNNNTGTVKIGPANFSLALPNVTLTNNNTAYTATDLQYDDPTERELVVSKKLSNLNVDYSCFENFVVFSSAEMRLKIFKNKIINLTTLSASLQQINTLNNNFLSASGSTYPLYAREVGTIQNQLDAIVDSFDGYESYLYRSGDYIYVNGGFVSASFVALNDQSASLFDKDNRDSLIKNTPAYVLQDDGNDDYIIFLAMMGHFFDDIYIYISSLPSVKPRGATASEEFTRRIVDYMLETFGWQFDDTLEQTTILNNYLNSAQLEQLDSMSAEERLQTVRNRILMNLSQIYKTKGTEEAVRLLLACYGIPSVLLSIREYGGINYTDDSAAYTAYERAYLYQWSTSSIYDRFQVNAPSNTKTYLTKIAISDSTPYSYGNEQILFGRVSGSAISSSVSGSGDWAVGFVRIPQEKSGQFFFRIGYAGAEQFKFFSQPFPLFDGNIYSVMLRRNYPSMEFEDSLNPDAVPCRYDLYIQRNESGLQAVYLTSSAICYNNAANALFDVAPPTSSIMIGGWFATLNGQGFTGAMDKWQMWYDPIQDSNFDDYANSINSYSFSGSLPAEQDLLFRMHTDYPFNVQATGSWRNASSYYARHSIVKQETVFGLSSAVSLDTMVNHNAWSGSQTLVYNSASCQYVSQSVYPYQFMVVDYPSTLPVTKYGPNRFRNEKVRFVSQSVASRFDDQTRSTFTPPNSTAPDSNQLGFFADPQDFKNKDIVRFFGGFDFMSVIGDPMNQFSSSYDSLRNFRYEYAQAKQQLSGSRTLFNELSTLFKLYFNNSIFAAIKNLVPARTNTLTGVIIEPTVLERPKYKAKPVFSEVNTGSVFYAEVTASRYAGDPDTKLMHMKWGIDYSEFGINTALSSFNTSSLPVNLTGDVSMSYVADLPSVVYPTNHCINGTYIPDLPDEYQFGAYGSLPSLLPLRAGDQTNGRMLFDMNTSVVPSGSSTVYLLKRWKRYNVYSKSGSWHRTENVHDNFYQSSSVYLYDYVVVSEAFFNSMVYTASVVDSTPGSPGSEFSSFQNLWTHYPNTFRNYPNSSTNSFLYTIHFNGLRNVTGTPVILTRGDQYFEIVGGYPRNHQTHKRDLFSLYSVATYGSQNGTPISGLYKRNQQSTTTTVGQDGLADGSSPVQVTNVSDVNLVQGSNVISQ